MSAINPVSQGLPLTIGFYGEGESKQFTPEAAVFGVAAHEAENHRVFENTAAARGELVADSYTTFKVAWDPALQRAVVVGGESHETLIKPTPPGGINLGGGGVLIDPSIRPSSPQNIQRAAEKRAQDQAAATPRGLDRLRQEGPDRSQIGRLSIMKATIHAQLGQIDAELARRKNGLAPDNGIPSTVRPPASSDAADGGSVTAHPDPDAVAGGGPDAKGPSGDTASGNSDAANGNDAAATGAVAPPGGGAGAAGGGGGPVVAGGGAASPSSARDAVAGTVSADGGPLSRAAAFSREAPPLWRAAAPHQPAPQTPRAPAGRYRLPARPAGPHPPPAPHGRPGAPVIHPAQQRTQQDQAGLQAQRQAAAPGPSDQQMKQLEAQRQVLSQQLQHVDDSLQKMTGELLQRLFGTVSGAIVQTERQAGAVAGAALVMNPALGGGAEDLPAGGSLLSGGSPPPATSAPPLPTPNYTAQGTPASNPADVGLLVNGVA